MRMPGRRVVVAAGIVVGLVAASVSAVVARSSQTGEATWTYAGPDRSGWIVNVIGVRGDTAVVVARRMKAAPLGSPKDEALNQSWLIGLDRTGKERWRHDMGSALNYDLAFGTKVADDTVITRNTPPGGGPGLWALDLATGNPQQVLTKGFVESIVSDGKSITFVANGLVVTLDHGQPR
ncbi:hypothetical protein ACFCV3_01945 [Kribbella sp. NPDC056345]|uniref:hypothetical protein n=1 Tax=Kribbella sp. NPDC056345 TaxID=3345789 RepID=UPI0035E19650